MIVPTEPSHAMIFRCTHGGGLLHSNHHQCVSKRKPFPAHCALRSIPCPTATPHWMPQAYLSAPATAQGPPENIGFVSVGMRKVFSPQNTGKYLHSPRVPCSFSLQVRWVSPMTSLWTPRTSPLVPAGTSRPPAPSLGEFTTTRLRNQPAPIPRSVTRLRHHSGTVLPHDADSFSPYFSRECGFCL